MKASGQLFVPAALPSGKNIEQEDELVQRRTENFLKI
jgi:hypothetical protein